MDAIVNTTKQFRQELEKLMPGYQWTVHKDKLPKAFREKFPDSRQSLEATGTQSSGSNRVSTLGVKRAEHEGVVRYTARSAGYGLRAQWLHEHTDGTLARAFRGLQDHYESVASTYRSHASALAHGRKAETPDPQDIASTATADQVAARAVAARVAARPAGAGVEAPLDRKTLRP